MGLRLPQSPLQGTISEKAVNTGLYLDVLYKGYFAPKLLLIPGQNAADSPLCNLWKLFAALFPLKSIGQLSIFVYGLNLTE